MVGSNAYQLLGRAFSTRPKGGLVGSIQSNNWYQVTSSISSGIPSGQLLSMTSIVVGDINCPVTDTK